MPPPPHWQTQASERQRRRLGFSLHARQVTLTDLPPHYQQIDKQKPVLGRRPLAALSNSIHTFVIHLFFVHRELSINIGSCLIVTCRCEKV